MTFNLFFRIISLLMSGVLLTNTQVLAQETPALSDHEIAHIGVVANQIDIYYADLAMKKSENEDIINFARTMKRDHNTVIKQATELVIKLGVTPVDNTISQSLKKDASETRKSLATLNGNAFDEAYIENEVAYHKAVIHTLENVLIPESENPELKNFLNAILPALKTHLHHAEMVKGHFK